MMWQLYKTYTRIGQLAPNAFDMGVQTHKSAKNEFARSMLEEKTEHRMKIKS